MCYTECRKGMHRMDGQIADLYHVPNIEQYADLHLLALSENCSALEEQVCQIAKSLPDKQRQIIETYICIRNDLEVETVKTALRWGRAHYL